jgi:hypothetical protein
MQGKHNIFGCESQEEREFRLASNPACSRLYKALSHPVTFPSFSNLSDLYNPSLDYWCENYGVLHISRDWALIAEVTDVAFFIRPHFEVRTRDGEVFRISFYPETPPLPGFDVSSVQVGHTFALLHAERKTFMDMTEGIRLENLSSCWVFKTSLQRLQQEAEQILASADAAHANTPIACFICGNPAASRCAKCKLARYCSRECQVKGWP